MRNVRDAVMIEGLVTACAPLVRSTRYICNSLDLKPVPDATNSVVPDWVSRYIPPHVSRYQSFDCMALLRCYPVYHKHSAPHDAS
jgi:hypothetical protein